MAPDMQKILKRLNEINFDSARLIEITIGTLAEQGYTALTYPYTYDYDEVFLLGSREVFRQYFRSQEELDISGIEMEGGADKEKFAFLTFANTVDILIFELLKNAVTNADFNAKDRTLKGKIHEDFYETQDGFSYEIEDNNKGIGADRLLGIFDICVSYSRFDPELPDYKEFAGLGIGLAKVLNIVDMHRGSLRIISRVEGEEAYE